MCARSIPTHGRARRPAAGLPGGVDRRARLAWCSSRPRPWRATSADPRRSASRRSLGARGSSAPSRRMLVIVNPYATTVSDRLKNLVVYALRGQLRGRRDRHRGPRPRHRAVPRGGPRGLRRRRRVRRRRHRQRGRQRPGRLRHAADLPARRSHQRLLPDARDPHRRRRRHRAPAAAGRRLAPAAGRPRAGQRALLPVLGRRRARRQRGRAGRRPPAAEGAARRVVLHLDRGPDVQPPLPVAPAAARGRARRRDASTASPRSSRTPRPTPTSAIGRSTWARARRSTAATWPASCCGAPARSTSRRSPGERCPSGPRVTRHRRVQRVRAASTGLRVRSLDERPLPLQVDGDYIGEVDEAVFGVDAGRDRRRRLSRDRRAPASCGRRH